MEKCNIFIKKEHRAHIEAIMQNTMELSYIHTFQHFPTHVKAEILDLAYVLILFPGGIKSFAFRERKQFVSVFVHFISKVREAENEPQLREKMQNCKSRYETIW